MAEMRPPLSPTSSNAKRASETAASQPSKKLRLDGKPPSFVTDISYRMAAFRKADNSPEDSQLSLDEFKALMKDLPLSKEIDVELLFHQADTNKDGVLVFDEFVNCFERVTGSALAQ